ncbi:uncharacterized protein V6R79_018945 [Siganus canaliculatus]
MGKHESSTSKQLLLILHNDSLINTTLRAAYKTKNKRKKQRQQRGPFCFVNSDHNSCIQLHCSSWLQTGALEKRLQVIHQIDDELQNTRVHAW